MHDDGSHITRHRLEGRRLKLNLIMVVELHKLICFFINVYFIIYYHSLAFCHHHHTVIHGRHHHRWHPMSTTVSCAQASIP